VDTLARIGQVRAVRSQEEAVLAVLDRTPAPDPSPIAALYDAHRIAAPLLRWLEAPIRAPAADFSAPLLRAQRAAERAEAELARARRSWAFKLGRLSFAGRH
jgi:hypothetical protein